MSNLPGDSPYLGIAHVAIETTGRLGSVAVLRGQRIIREVNLDPNCRSATTLAPALRDTLSWCEQQGESPGFVSIADGPGSFTGLRIGVTTAKTLCYALELPLVAVDSLAAIAAAALHTNPECQRIWSVLDAYRGQVFMGQFERASLFPDQNRIPSDWSAHPKTVQVLQREDWDAMLREKSQTIAVAGDPKPLGARSGELLKRNCDAVGVGLLAVRAAVAGQFCDPLALVPRYLRASAAEEKAAML
jgi:tRNA threonylcarbamoyl adenosine modification protein YeaZ